MKTGVFIGRFQPLHNGHLDQIKRIVSETDSLLIILGTPKTEAELGLQNPFTTDERLSMISTVLDKYCKIPYSIKIVHDHLENHPIWLKELEDALPANAIVYTGNKLVKKLCDERGIQTLDVIENFDVHGTKVRELLYSEKDIKLSVPIEILDFINEIAFKRKMWKWLKSK